MKCKNCGRSIENNSIFCNWCGEKQLQTKKKRDVIRVPTPRRLSSGMYNIELRAEKCSITEKTAELCLARARAIRAGFIIRQKNAPKITPRQAMQQYIDQHALLSPSTLLGYDSIMKTRFQSVVDCDVSAIDWQAAINAESKIVSPKTLNNSWRFVKAALVNAGCDVPNVTLPKVVKNDLPWLDYEQIVLFLDAIRDRPGELGALLALHSLRKSEIYALTVGKIDKKRQLIKVSGAVVHSMAGLVEKKTNKTSASQRDVPIMIPRLLELVPDGPLDAKLITCHINTLYDQINSACERAGLPKVGVHGLRRSFASLAYHLDWDMLTTMRVGGWSNDTIVKAVYIKLSGQDVNADVEQMRQFYEQIYEREK